MHKLETFCNDNNYISAFYAKWTFEVDFINAGNEHEVKGCLKNIYSVDDRIEKSEKLLKSKDIKVKGMEILRLGKKIRKGWFALLLAEQLSAYTYFPEYILEACMSSNKVNFRDNKVSYIINT